MELLCFHYTLYVPAASSTVAELGGTCFMSYGQEQRLSGIDVL